jgi:peptidoglycan/xylan/chitin deacetylase (PgdA/CDA1 family)
VTTGARSTSDLSFATPMPRHAPETSRFLISLDFELMWGVRERRTIADYGENVLGARRAIPVLLETFARHGVRATWATVGMLLFDSKEELLAHLPIERPRYARRALDPYADLDTIGDDERSDPHHFGLSLARQIAACEGMELASHTFSHFFALADGQTQAQFEADLEASIASVERIAPRPVSLVFPRNQVNAEYLEACRRLGFTGFRGNERSWMYTAGDEAANRRTKRAARLVDAYLPLSGANTSRPSADAGMVDLPSSRFLRPATGAPRRLERLRVRRVTTAMESAARTGATFHLWWHPHNFGRDLDRNLHVLEEILAVFGRLRRDYGMRSLTMREAAAEVTAA